MFCRNPIFTKKFVMEKVATVVLKPGKDAALRRFHPWIFSGAIRNIEGDPGEGDVVRVVGPGREFLALGHLLQGNIAVKVFSFSDVLINNDFWITKLQDAYSYRLRIGLAGSSYHNSYRLVFSEGDGLPGLIIDLYNGVAVVQTHSPGMRRLLPVFVEGLTRIYGGGLRAVYHKSTDSSGDQGHDNRFLMGDSGPAEIVETGNRFMVDFINGQKTGFFLDQRSNRMFAHFYANGRTVLNTFCYSGAFSVYALKGGARFVRSVDISKRAVEWTGENLALNGFDNIKHPAVVADVKDYLVNGKEQYDMIILDPPAFAKSHRVSNNALHAYIHINSAAMQRLNRGGILFTFSCSQAISREMFRSAIQTAAIETGRRVRIMHHLSQGPDHPVDACHPEGEYLKGMILMVE